MRIVRRIQGSQSTSEEKIVEFAVKPGWKTGNKVTFKQWVFKENGEIVVWETRFPVIFRRTLFLSFRRSHIPFTREKGAI